MKRGIIMELTWYEQMRIIRERNKWYQKEVADKLGMKETTYSLMERGGVNKIKPIIAQKVFELFGIDKCLIPTLELSAPQKEFEVIKMWLMDKSDKEIYQELKCTRQYVGWVRSKYDLPPLKWCNQEHKDRIIKELKIHMENVCG
jgi:transcriptional regulator with XRE-family HTH domain